LNRVTEASPRRQATSLFRDRFGSGPLALVSAPGRINLLGEHTDYNGGPVLPFAVERRTVVAAGRGESDRFEAVSTVEGLARTIDPDRLEAGVWTAYVCGVIRALRRKGLAPDGARLAIASSVPVGAGLSSSAALTVGVTRALLSVAGRRLPPGDLADIAYLAEHDEVGVRCGRMDQTVAALARAGHALLLETATGAITHLPLPGRIWVIETGVAHRLSGGDYNLRRQECETALQLVRERGRAVHHLAEIPAEDLPALLRAIPAPWGARLRHVVTETARCREAARALATRDLRTLGSLLVEGHQSLRQDFQSSCPEADHLVETLMRSGACGARLTGAGWGGAVVAVLPPDGESRIVAEAVESFRSAFGRLPTAWTTRAGAGARSEK
jgi:galactokinase